MNVPEPSRAVPSDRASQTSSDRQRAIAPELMPAGLELATVRAFIREHWAAIQSYGVTALGVFGSVARDRATPTSDLDLLVEFAGPVTFDQYMDLKFFLEDALQVKVDLVSPKMLKPQIRQAVLAAAVDVA